MRPNCYLHTEFYGCLGDYIGCQCLRGTSTSSFGGRNLHRGLGDHIDPRRLGGWVGRASVGKPRSPEMPYEASHMRHQRQQASSPGTLRVFITFSTHWARTRSFTMRTQDLDSRSALLSFQKMQQKCLGPSALTSMPGTEQLSSRYWKMCSGLFFLWQHLIAADGDAGLGERRNVGIRGCRRRGSKRNCPSFIWITLRILLL